MLVKEHHVLNIVIFVFTVTLVSIFALNTQQATFAQSSNLVAHYTFDEGTGTTVGDSSSNNNALSLNGGALFSTGQSGTALSFDGNNDYASRQDAQLTGSIPSKSSGGAQDFTITAWINVNQLGSRAPIVTKQGNSTRGFVLRMNNDNTLNMELWKNNSNGSFVSSSNTLSANTWVHTAVTYDFINDGTSIMTLFIDGSQVGQTTNAVGPPAQNSIALEVGRTFWSVSFNEYFNGQIDEVYIYDTVLTQSEIQTIMNDLPVPPPPPPTQICNNGTVEGTEVCDQNTTQCTTLGFDNGTASCNSLCTGFNTSTCSNDTTPPPPPSGSSSGTTIDLGDLEIAAQSWRIPQWYPASVAEAGYEAAKSWPEYDVTNATQMSGLPQGGCGTANPADNGGEDWAPINCAIKKVPDFSVVYIPNGRYDMGDSGGEIIKINRNNMVIRGESSANTHLYLVARSPENNFKNAQSGSACPDNKCRSSILSVGTTVSGTTTPWIGGYSEAENIITVSDISRFNVNELKWIKLDMTCSALIHNPTGPDNLSLTHTAKVISINGNNITIDRGLRFDYGADGCQGSAVAKLFTPNSNIGIENLHFTSDPNTIPQGNIGNGRSGFSFRFMVESWAVGNHVERFEDIVIGIGDSSRIWIQGNKMEDFGYWGGFNTEGMSFERGANDNVIENNYGIDFNTFSKFNGGPEGNIIGFNYLNNGNPASGAPERSIMVHGMYARANLIVGNDVTHSLDADTTWGMNGPYNTWYRNRITGVGTSLGIRTKNSDKCANHPAGSSEEAGCIARVSDDDPKTKAGPNLAPPTIYGNFIGNNAPNMENFENGLYDERSQNSWVERNVIRADLRLSHPTTNCGTGIGNCPGTNIAGFFNQGGSNIETVFKADPSWSGEVVPASLYRTEIPSWWCQETVKNGLGEACDWHDAQNGIGAWGDDLSNPSSLCKLPAQIRVDIIEGRGGVCTPVGGGTPPPPPPTGLTNLFLTPTIEGRTSVVGQTFSVRIFSQGGTTALETFSITANSTGKLLIPSNTLTSGTYDIHLKSPGHLGRKFTNLSLTSNTTITLSGQLRVGDLNNDNVINSLDWSVMNPLWFTNDLVADLNGDGIVNTIDFSFLSGNWFEMGD